MPRLRNLLTTWRRRPARAAGAPATTPEAPAAVPHGALAYDADMRAQGRVLDAPVPAGVTYARKLKGDHAECRRLELTDGAVRVECLCGYSLICRDDASATDAIDKHAAARNLMSTRRRR